MHSAHPGLSSDYCDHHCEEDFFFLFFLIIGLLHLVIEHYIVEKKIFLSLFVYSWIFLSDYCVWDNSLDDDDREDLVGDKHKDHIDTGDNHEEEEYFFKIITRKNKGAQEGRGE